MQEGGFLFIKAEASEAEAIKTRTGLDFQPVFGEEAENLLDF